MDNNSHLWNVPLSLLLLMYSILFIWYWTQETQTQHSSQSKQTLTVAILQCNVSFDLGDISCKVGQQNSLLLLSMRLCWIVPVLATRHVNQFVLFDARQRWNFFTFWCKQSSSSKWKVQSVCTSSQKLKKKGKVEWVDEWVNEGVDEQMNEW